jgi:heme-degrading monooxygenase HmoA
MMLTRIVRMVFRPESVADFLAMFQEKSVHIRTFPGCEKLELWQDETFDNIFYTHSHWHSKAALENYRKSDLFKSVWKLTKQGFADRAQAWSTRVIKEVTQN